MKFTGKGSSDTFLSLTYFSESETLKKLILKSLSIASNKHLYKHNFFSLDVKISNCWVNGAYELHEDFVFPKYLFSS